MKQALAAAAITLAGPLLFVGANGHSPCYLRITIQEAGGIGVSAVSLQYSMAAGTCGGIR